MKEKRINLFNQIKSFYELVWHGDFDFKPAHISLYIFLLNQNNRTNWSTWFKLPRDTGMQGSCIGSKKTYYKCLSDLVEQKLIKKEDGKNEHKAPRISIQQLKRGDEVPIPEYHQVYHLEGQKGDTTYTATYTATDPSRGTQPIPLGVRDKDYKTIDLKTEDNKKEIYPKIEDPSKKKHNVWWE